MIVQDMKEEYVDLLVNRLTHSSLSLEKDLGNPDDSKNALRLYDGMVAFKRLLERKEEPLTLDKIVETGDLVNASAWYISRGYRKMGEYLVDTNIPISKPENISGDMERLVEEYQEAEEEGMDPFLQEAYFHIRFIRIHPFEDGNGRTSRLLLNANLLQKEIVPVIITDDLLPFYYSYIEQEDAESMAHLFRIQSQKEEKVMKEFQERYQASFFEHRERKAR